MLSDCRRRLIFYGIGDTSVYEGIGTFEENGVGSSGLD